MPHGVLASAQPEAATQVIGSCGDDDADSIRKPPLPSAPSSPLLLDMKVQQGCNSSDMGIPVTTEEELRRNTVITPEDVLGLQKITKSK